MLGSSCSGRYSEPEDAKSSSSVSTSLYFCGGVALVDLRPTCGSALGEAASGSRSGRVDAGSCVPEADAVGGGRW